ncbi:MAG: hypothetical protein V1754_10215, partial [Pseudomonadota bacterium]
MSEKRHSFWWAIVLSLMLHQIFLGPTVSWLFKKPQLALETTEVELVPEISPLEKVSLPQKIIPKIPILKPLVPRPPAPKLKTHPSLPNPQPNNRLKMVEVDNPESEKPPDKVRFLSDKNRKVERETRARRTQLAKQKKDEKVEKAPSEPFVLSMRPKTIPSPNRSIPKLGLGYRAYDRIVGKRSEDERKTERLALRTPRVKKYEQRLSQIRAALENFIPEVQPGNQTALGTRADPFAVYIAR